MNNLEDRVKALNAEFIPLLTKYKLGLGAVAFILPDGRIAAKPQLFDDSKPKESKAEDKPILSEA